jgi:hypothetical protein
METNVKHKHIYNVLMEINVKHKHSYNINGKSFEKM